MTYEAAVAAIPTVKHVQDLVDSIPQVRLRNAVTSMLVSRGSLNDTY